jgi:hypothetical protein
MLKHDMTAVTHVNISYDFVTYVNTLSDSHNTCLKII